jgi:AcrR family transcriptional regulator
MSAADQGSGPAFEDLTARARIRDAALKHFAERGFAQATVREIARTAGVSPGLIRHHFGSKEALRAAVDEHVLSALRQFNEQALAKGQFASPGFAASSRSALKPFQRYIARALAEGSEAATVMFDEMASMTEMWLASADKSRSDDYEPADRKVRAALINAMAAGIPLLHEHISRVLGVDMFSPEGDRRLAPALLDIHSHNLISPELAAAARAGFEQLTKLEEGADAESPGLGHPPPPEPAPPGSTKDRRSTPDD